MSFVLLVEPVFFGSDPAIKDNQFTSSARVSGQKADNDHVLASTTINDERQRLLEDHYPVTLLRMKNDPRGSVVYASRGDAIFPSDSISFHNFTNADGMITRRLVILYPMSTYRRGELPRVQLLNKVEAAAKREAIELVDLRAFEEDNRSLEGSGALSFSADGQYVYMSRSKRTDDEVLDIVCSSENLDIPTEHRFLFSSAIPGGAEGEEYDIYHTSIVGWVGHRICAWGLKLMQFDTEDDTERFYNHLEQDFDLVLQLSMEEVLGFAGNAIELAQQSDDGRVRRVLCMSESAMKALDPKNLAALQQWYGEDNIVTFYGEVLERRAGCSIRSTMAASITHGESLPVSGQPTTLEVCGIAEK